MASFSTSKNWMPSFKIGIKGRRKIDIVLHRILVLSTLPFFSYNSFRYAVRHETYLITSSPRQLCHWAEEPPHQYVFGAWSYSLLCLISSLDPAGFPALPSTSQALSAAASAALNLDNIQGDILYDICFFFLASFIHTI
jgi:hypothetical protein